MLQRLLKAEERLARIESWALVFVVLLMLALAAYNVFYRNVLVPIQVASLPQSGPVAAPPPQTSEPSISAAPSAKEHAGTDGFGGGFGDEAPSTGDEAEGFGGGFGGDFEEPTKEAPTAADEAEGFGGDFEEPAKDAPKEAPKAAADESEGFGGDFEEAAKEAPSAPAAEAEGFGGDFEEPTDESGGFGGDFEGAADGADDPAAEPTEAAPSSVAGEVGQPEEPGFMVAFVDAVKLEWIDVLLRQLVLLIGFLGAALATRRRKHITIDALSKLLTNAQLLWVQVATAALAAAICVLLAVAGWDLVAISLEFPKELTWFADEWVFQLSFPFGFGLLALHFCIRVLESATYALGRAEPPEDYFEAGAV